MSSPRSALAEAWATTRRCARSARDELGQRERLDEVVDRARVQPGDAVLDLARARQHDDRQRRVWRARRPRGSPGPSGRGASGRARPRRSSPLSASRSPSAPSSAASTTNPSACRPRRTKSTIPGSSSISRTRGRASSPSRGTPCAGGDPDWARGRCSSLKHRPRSGRFSGRARLHELSHQRVTSRLAADRTLRPWQSTARHRCAPSQARARARRVCSAGGHDRQRAAHRRRPAAC